MMEGRMSFDNFVNNVKDEITLRYKGKAEVKIQEVTKNNGVVLKAIIIRLPGENMVPSVYLENFYELYLEGQAFEECCGLICQFSEQNRTSEKFVVENYFDYEWVKKHISIRLINTENNRDLLKSVPNRKFLDLSIVYMCLFPEFEFGEGSALIRNEHMQQWGVEEKNLYKAAFDNMSLYMKPKYKKMGEYLQEAYSFMGNETPEIINGGCLDFLECYILSNVRRIYGAAVILYPELLSDIADDLGRDLLIIPSSVHEVIIMPENERTDREILRKMIKEVNREAVSREDRLSDELYVYKRKLSSIAIAELW